MDKNPKDILGSLPAELLEAVSAEIEAKVAEARIETEAAIREEMSARYEQDKSQMVEAMDATIEAVLESFRSDKASELANLRGASERLEEARKSMRVKHVNKLREHFNEANKLISTKLAEVIREHVKAAKALDAERALSEAEREEFKTRITEAHNEQVAKIDKFIINHLTREIKEFHIDRRALVETRISLISENKKKLAEAQSRFIKESAKVVDNLVTKQLKVELASIHEDIERNRRNHFGARVFEAFVAEFMSSPYSDHTEAKKFKQLAESMQSELDDARVALTESKREIENAKRQVTLTESESKRKVIMAELLAPLRGEKRAVMESMLEGVPTQNLRKSFGHFVPMVVSKPAKAQPKTLSESKATTKLVTGDQRNQALVEAAQPAPSADPAAADIVRLALRK